MAEVAVRLASEINADAILALTETGKNCGPLFRNPPIGRDPGKKIKLVLATTSHYQKFSTNPAVRPIKLAAREQGRFGQTNHAMGHYEIGGEGVC
ncbi:MAG: hypothetical protein IBX64_07000 [Actinobacteria bacterium]|nr:hypothetical protein [Actinomycetota bacterium]